MAATGSFTVTNNTGTTTPIPQADLDTLLRGITYQNTSNDPTPGDRTLSFTATDAQLTGGTEREALSASWTDLQNKDYWTLGGNAEQTSIRILITNL